MVKPSAISQDDASEPVLVFNGKQQVAQLVYEKDFNEFYWRSCCSEGWQLTNVTHWMYLPEEPEVNN